MDNTIKYLAQRHTVLMRISGMVDDPNEVGNMAREGIALAARHNCNRFLADYTGATLQASTFDVYEFAKSQDALGYKLTDKCAAVIHGDEKAHNRPGTF